jgi:hypothetical protein
MHFWWHVDVLMKREELSFMGMKLSWHSYQLSMSHRIKCIWNYGVKLSIENGCFIRVSFHSIWHGSLENNEIKLSTETGLIVKKITTSGDSQFYYLHVMVVLFSNQNDIVSNKK